MSTEETAWLVEFFGQGRPTYWGRVDNEDDGVLGMTREHSAAVRFCRREDAQAFIDHIGWTEAQAIEHMWVDGTLHSLAARTALRR